MQDSDLQITDIFETIVGDSLKNISFDQYQVKKDGVILSVEIDNFIDIIYNHESLKLSQYSEELRQFYIWFILGKQLFKFNESHLKVDIEEFEECVYYPNMMNIIIYRLKLCKKILYKIVRDIYKEVEETSLDIVDFYFILSNTESSIIQSDIVNIFIKSLFLEINPLSLENIKGYYSSTFRYLFFSYLKNRTTGLLDYEIDPIILDDENNIMTSTRYNIYEVGIRLSQLHELCNKSSTLKQISKNYDNIKNQITSNSLQQLYSFIIDKNPATDKKLIVLKTNAGSHNLSKIRKRMPLIYKLLRSIHVVSTNGSSFTDLDKELINNSIYDIVSNKFKNLLDEKYAYSLTKLISANLTKSLTCGKFIDPYSMDTITIKGPVFINQLKEFLSIILDNLECNFDYKKKQKFSVNI